MACYIGVDSGGTKTAVMRFDAHTGRIVTALGPESNAMTVGWAASAGIIRDLVRSVLQGDGDALDETSALSVCTAGVDHPEQARHLHALLREYFPSVALEVQSDALAALAAGTLGEPGVALIAGTGSIAVGEDDAGRIARAGGYGNLIGDEGSGFDLGRRGLLHAIQYAEGRGSATALWDCAQQAFRVHRPHELIVKIYEARYPVGAVASFAEQVMAAAGRDDVAGQIVREAVGQYVLLIRSVTGQLNDSARELVLGGGVLQHNPSVREVLQAEFPALRVSLLQRAPVAGAVLRALRLGGAPAGPRLLSLLAEAGGAG